MHKGFGSLSLRGTSGEKVAERGNHIKMFVFPIDSGSTIGCNF
jgi:hypothetical protein